MSDIKTFWNARAADPSLDAAQVTHPDIWQRWLEIEALKQLIPQGSRLVDIGCGAGVTVKELAPILSAAVGIDFSEGMIQRARAQNHELSASVRFEVADVLKLDPAQLGIFDVAVTIRCLINLPDWDAQRLALRNIAAIVRPGGMYYFIEGSADGRESLNALRQAVGLEAMPIVWHNLDFERERTLTYLDRWFSLEAELGFGSYDLVSRVVHPLLVAPDQPKYRAKINEFAARAALHRLGDKENSRVAFYCLRRRSHPTGE